MAIQLFDSLSRSLKPLQPSQPDGVFRFYNCGLTVYAAGHIGNFRTFVINDVLRRLLELEFGKDKVKHVRNLTDVDDKTIQRAREEGRPLADVTKYWTDKFHEDCIALNCLAPHHEPRATDPRFLNEQVNMINVLLEKGNAYRAPDGSVYFKVSSFKDYGRLSRLNERVLQPGATLKTYAADADEKEDGSDFALWKAWKSDDGVNKWPGPNGASDGRPGWHIECSAMSKALLGQTIDLHTGGVDLLFPHHENEIAQSQCCNGVTFARHWYHSEHLLVDGKKMSKSLGNYYTLTDLIDKGYSPMAVRYALLSGHPRKQLNFTLDSLHAANSAILTLRALRSMLHEVGKTARSTDRSDRFDRVIEALKNDLNLPAALGALFTIRNEIIHGAGAPLTSADAEAFDTVAVKVLGFDLPLVQAHPQEKLDIPAAIADLAAKRWAAKQAKDFATADALRKDLTAAGWSMLDGKDGYKLEPLKK